MTVPKRPWKRILTEQEYPDNYTDPDFMKTLKEYKRGYNFWQCVYESGNVTQQISSVCVFVVMFIYMDTVQLSPATLLLDKTILTVFGYIIFRIVGDPPGQTYHRSKWADLKTVVLLVSFSFGLSPVLMTLTDTISTDTIYAMTTAMLLCNLLFHDYGADSAIVSQSLSFNAAIFSSVCLASRLPTSLHTFTTVTFAVEIFSLWPALRKRLKTKFPKSHVMQTVLCGCLATLAIFSISVELSVLFILFHLFITFICPLWLIHMQQYHGVKHGQWSEAQGVQADKRNS